MYHLVAGNPSKDVKKHPSEVRTCEALICMFFLFPLCRDISGFCWQGPQICLFAWPHVSVTARIRSGTKGSSTY